MADEGTNRKIFWGVAIAAAAVVAAVLLWPGVEEELAPEPVRGWAAVEVEGAGTAVVGRVEMAEGTPFRVHAVLEGRGRGGETVYYTDAPGLTIGGERVPAERLRRWERQTTVRVLWFTVEGVIPYLSLQEGQDLSRFRFEGFFRPEWGSGWSVPGELEPANDARLVREDRQGRLPFGTQRYQARIEIFRLEDDLVPRQRFESPGPAAVMADPAAFPTAVVTLPGPAGPASAVFGLTGIEPPLGAGEELQATLLDWTRERLAFGRVSLLRAILDAAGFAFDQLEWRLADLEAGPPWGGEGVATGDLLRVGERFVVLYQDRGQAGVLDREDLCFDYARGSVVRPLGHVFAGGGDIEWVRLASAPSERPAGAKDRG
jgi:hypothetical protein